MRSCNPYRLLTIHKNSIHPIVANTAIFARNMVEGFKFISVIPCQPFEVTKPDKTLIVLQKSSDRALYQSIAIGKMFEINRIILRPRYCLVTQQEHQHKRNTN